MASLLQLITNENDRKGSVSSGFIEQLASELEYKSSKVGKLTLLTGIHKPSKFTVTMIVDSDKHAHLLRDMILTKFKSKILTIVYAI